MSTELESRQEFPLIKMTDDLLARHIQSYERDNHPYHSVLLLGLDLLEEPQEIINELTEELKIQALEDRAEHLAAYIRLSEGGDPRDIVREAIERLTRDQKGNKVPAEEFEKKLSNIYGAVFTGHPTFSMNQDQSELLSKYFTELAGLQETDPKTKRALHESLSRPFRTPNLDSESDQSIDAIKNLHEAISDIERLAIEIAQKAYPKEWTKLTYAPVTAATWIPFDWDGRKDIHWSVLMEKRIGLQMEMLADYAERLDNLCEYLSGSQKGSVTRLCKQVRTAQDKLKKHREYFKGHYQSKDEGLAKLAAASRKFVKDADERITNPKVLIAPLEKILEQSSNEEAQARLVHLISRLRNHGITLARVHFRINSKSVLTAFDEHRTDIKIDSTLPDTARDNAYLAQITDLLDDVAPKRSNIIDVARAQGTIFRQMIMIRQIVDDLDNHSPIRFLIAETQNAIVPLSALYFAKELGIEDHIDISPLFEDRGGIDAAEEVVKTLYADKHYREYIRKRGKACFQLGYSDSGRFDGQLPAGAFIEKVKGEILKQHHKHKLHDVDVCFFDTHGESIGRGSHPGDATNRIAYANTPFNLADANKKKITIRPEESFQGGDGYLLHGTPEASLAYLSHALKHLTADHSDVKGDIYYKSARDRALAFFERARTHQAELARDPNYAEVVKFFTGLMPVTGSRPVERQKESGGERKLPRAIPHNGILAQLGIQANVLYGLGQAVRADKEGFRLLVQDSPEFRRRLAFAYEAMKVGDPDIMRAYIKLYDPEFWQNHARAQKEDPAEKKRCLSVAWHLRRQGHYDRLASVVEKLADDYDFLKVEFEKLELPFKAPKYEATEARKKFNRYALHGARISAMIGLFTRAVQIPDIAARNDISRNEEIARIMRLDSEGLQILRDIFRKSANGFDLETLDAGKPSDLADMGFDYSHLQEELIDPMEEALKAILHVSHGLIHCNHSVG